MSWTSLIGRSRPLQADALRLCTLIHQLGDDGGEDPIVRKIDGEAKLQALDHLVRRPSALAFVLVDQFERRPELADRRGALARRVRQVLINERQQHLSSRRRRAWQSRGAGSPPRAAFHEFVAPRWQRYDDALALLASRDLVRVAVSSGKQGQAPDLTYGLTSSGAELLETDIYPNDRNSNLHLQLCSIIADLLPSLDGSRWQQLFDEIDESVDAFIDQEQLPPELDPLSELFHHVFQERL